MTIRHFNWTDLSTYDTTTARDDYTTFFGWNYQNDGGYYFALSRGQEIAALFLMPDRLAKINMPSFWMSYIHVGNVDDAVRKAKHHDGVVVEVEPEAFGNEARIALVRDPSGAGFTLYEGPELTPEPQGFGCVECRFHHSSDINVVKDFYIDLFEWQFDVVEEQPWPSCDARYSNGTTVARFEEVPEDIRGKYNYWMPCFRVESTGKLVQLITSRGGELLTEFPDNRIMVADRQGAHFMLRSTTSD